MPKSKSAVKTAAEVAVVAKPKLTLPELSESTRELIQAIRTDISTVPTDTLVPFYVLLDANVIKGAGAIADIIKEEMKRRREQGDKTGEKKQHRFFHANLPQGTVELTIQERSNEPFNAVKCREILGNERWQQVVDLKVTGDTEAFFRFLRKHRAELKEYNLELEEELNEKKLQALIDLKKVTTDEVEQMIDKLPPTYAVVPKFKKS